MSKIVFSFPRQMIFWGISVVAILANTAIAGENRPVYQVNSVQDYLKLVPVAVYDNYIPVIIDTLSTVNPDSRYFAEMYGGDILVLNAPAVDSISGACFKGRRTAIFSESDPDLAWIASALAAVMKAPLVMSDSSNGIKARGIYDTIIVVGKIESGSWAGTHVVDLETIDKVRDYYNSKLEDAIFCLKSVPGPLCYLGAMVAARHRAVIVFENQEIARWQPDYFIWLTSPDAISPEFVRGIYKACTFSDDGKIYDPSVGILTAFNGHDLSLLLARTFTYPALKRDWLNNYFSGSVDTRSESNSWTSGDFTFEIVDGEYLTPDRFNESLMRSGYVDICAHGHPAGLALSGGSWPGKNPLPLIPPLIFAAEACSTADIAADTGRAMALRLIRAGAVAFIGSMQIGGVNAIGERSFAFSFPRQPLGEFVRLQNAGRMELDADWPRVILLGDPAFYQFSQGLYETTRDDRGRGPVFRIKPSHTIPDTLPINLLFEFEAEQEIKTARGFRTNRETVVFTKGSLQYSHGLAVIYSGGINHILLEWPGGEGLVEFYPGIPLSDYVFDFVNGVFLGFKCIFVDMMTAGMPHNLIIPGIICLIIGLAVLRYGQARGRRHVLSALISGLALGAVVMILYLIQGNIILWQIVITSSFGAALIAYILSPRLTPLRFALWGTLIFLIPFVFLILAVLKMIPVTRVIVYMIQIVIFLGVVFGLILYWGKRLFYKNIMKPLP